MCFQIWHYFVCDVYIHLSITNAILSTVGVPKLIVIIPCQIHLDDVFAHDVIRDITSVVVYFKVPVVGRYAHYSVDDPGAVTLGLSRLQTTTGVMVRSCHAS